MAKIYWNNLEDELVQAIKNPVIQGVVKKINGKTPDADGSIDISAEDLGALSQADLVNNLTSGGTNKALTAEQGKVLKDALDTLTTLVNSSITGAVKTVNTKAPNAQGNVTITASDINVYEKEDVDDKLNLKINKSDIDNTLTSDSMDRVLSAQQGKVLKGLIDSAAGMSPEDKAKLDGIQPQATRVLVEDNLESESMENALSAKQGNELKKLIDTKGDNYVLPAATTVTIGGVKPDGTTILVTADGTISATGTMTGEEFTQAEKTKLAGIADEANKYVLPVGSTTILGGLKPDGTTIKVTAEGVISTEVADLTGYIKTVNTTLTPDTNGNIVLTIGDLDGYTKTEVNTLIEDNKYTLPIATSSILGGVKIGTGVSIAADGTISVAEATTDIIDEKLPIVLSPDYPQGHSIFITTANSATSKAWLALVNEPEVPTTKILVETYKTTNSTTYQRFTLLKINGLTPFAYERTHTVGDSSWSVAAPVGTFAKRNATPPDIPPISPVYGSEKVTLFTINGALQFNDQWIESMGLTLTDANRAIIETYKETDSAGITSVTQFAKVFLNTTFKGEYVRFMNASQGWSAWTKTTPDPEVITDKIVQPFVATAVADATHDFIYKVNFEIKDGDKFMMCYNTTVLPEGSWTIETVGTDKVIVLNVEEATEISRNEVHGIAYRGFKSLI